jgi:hypothetical protein
MDNRSEHVVFFPGADGGPAFRRLPSLDEAVRFVEHLRNVEGVSEVSAYALAEVPLAFRPYYRVEVGAAPAEAAVPVAVPVADEPAGPVADAAEEPVAEVAADEPAEEMVPAAREEHSSNGRRGLAFFAS